MRRTTQLGIFSLAMITAGSVDSIRNLPTTALSGSSLIFLFLLAAVFFLLPTALISAELSSTTTEEGGVYAWVKQAFGPSAGFLAIWFQWIENVIWYPTILSFVAGTISYLMAPQLAENRFFLLAVILITFWSMTILNLRGMRVSARFSNWCAITGLIIPMMLIMGLGAFWFFSGHPLQIHFSADTVVPKLHQSGIWVALTGIILSFCGMEIATVHGVDVKQPQRSYPRAMLLATLIILVTLLFSSLAIAIVIPADKISLVSGIMQAYDVFFGAVHLSWVMPIIAIMLIMGGLGGINNWIIAPTRGLSYAIKDMNGDVPEYFKENSRGAPVFLLVGQAVVVTVIAFVFLLMPSVNGAYWLLTALATQLYMFMYLLMFAAAVRLRYTDIPRREGYQIPGGKVWGVWTVSIFGFIGCVLALVVGFIPPLNLGVGGVWNYELLLGGGVFVLSVLPWWFYRMLSKDKTIISIPLAVENVMD